MKRTRSRTRAIARCIARVGAASLVFALVWTGNAAAQDGGGGIPGLPPFDWKDLLSPETAYGALLGLVGLILQLFFRAEWPRGRLNEGKETKVIDPKALVLAVISGVVIGAIAWRHLTTDAVAFRAAAVIALSYLAADAATGYEKVISLIKAIGGGMAWLLDVAGLPDVSGRKRP